jgi:maleylpyruvate isomerase
LHGVIDPARLLNDHVEGCSAAHQRLLAAVDDRDEAWVRADSLLPGWTRAHVLTHLARNAEGLTRLLEHANRGEVTDQYPGGMPARNAAIEAGARRPLSDIVADLRAATWALEAAWVATTQDGWQGSGRLSSGAVIPVREVPFRRWREVEVHHADLDCGFTWSDWSGAYVRHDLAHQEMLWKGRQPMGRNRLPDAALRLDPAARLAWLLGRHQVDGLPAPDPL